MIRTISPSRTSTAPRASRRTVIGLLAAMAMTPARAGLGDLVDRFGSSHDTACLSVVLVDVTASIGSEDWKLYERAFEELLRADRAGDRIVIGAIGDRPVSKFIAHADRLIELKHKRLEDQANLTRANAALKNDFVEVRGSSAVPAQATFILDAISATDQLFAQGRSRGQGLNLLVLSDMIEESPVANFARRPGDAALAEKLVATRRAQGLLPDLRGVRVYVVGAGGKNGEQMARVKTFWTAYLSATGAQLQVYGRTPGPVAR